MVKISVIVPVYNCEDYLEESIRSILNQTFKDIEVVCVADGSTDNSLSILNKLSDDDSRLKVHTQENQGASVARNNALKKVSGDYIYFFDADDYLVADALEKAYNNAVNNNSDIVIFNYDQYKELISLLNRIYDLEKEYIDRKLFKSLTLGKIRETSRKIMRIVETFNNNVNYR